MTTVGDELGSIASAHGKAVENLVGKYRALRAQGMSRDDALNMLRAEAEEMQETQNIAADLDEKVPIEKPSITTEPAPTTVAEPEITELLEGDAAERSRIASMEIKKSAEIFGNKAKRPDADMLVLKAENDADLTMGFPKGLNYSNDRWNIVNRVQAVRSTRNKLSTFGAFLRKYKRWPTIGLEVETDLDADGFARIVVEKRKAR